MSREASAKKLQELLNDELCTLVACRSAMERLKEPATVAGLRQIAARHEDSISHLRAAIVDRAEEPGDDPAMCDPWIAPVRTIGTTRQNEVILATLRKTEALCRDRSARAAATVGLLDETARRMIGEVIAPRHLESLASLDKMMPQRESALDGTPHKAVKEAIDTMTSEGSPVVPPVTPDQDAAIDSEPHPLEALKDLVGQLAKAGLMVGVYGAAVALQPFRYVLRRGMAVLSPTPTA